MQNDFSFFKNPDSRLIAEKKLYIFDMDGTIYLGNRIFSFAIDFINHLRRNGKKVLFFTNNASHSRPFYVEKLNRIGFSPKAEEVMTSGDVTIGFLKGHRAGKTVYLVGTDDLVSSFRDAGISLVDESVEKADIVVTSFDTTLTYEKLNAACRYIRNGAEYLSTHPDFNCPVENGFIPDSGAIAAFVTASTGALPTYFGKPCAETLVMIAESTGFDKSEMCVFGDRLYTDIAFGRKNGVCSVLVMSGETTAEALRVAAQDETPDFTFASLAEVDGALFDSKGDLRYGV